MSRTFGSLGVALAFVALALTVGCGASRAGDSLPTPLQSASPDAVTQSYVSLIRQYWADYETARGHIVTACWEGPISARVCGQLSSAILQVDERFLADLQATTPPPQFAAQDQALKAQFPKVIAAVRAMVAASATGKADAVYQATLAYVDTMIPTVTDALDQIDPSTAHT